MTIKAFLAALQARLSGVPWGRRAAWCRTQRRHLRMPGQPVVWLRGENLPWAEWGARRGYFELQEMDGLRYLRALAAPGA